MRGRLAALNARSRAGLRAMLAGALLTLPGAGLSAPFVIPLGPDRLVLDTPPGFSDTAFLGSPRLAELAEQLTDASNRVLVFALSDADVRRFTLGDALELRRYVLGVMPRAAERERMGSAQFGALAGESQRDLGTAPAVQDFSKYLDGKEPGQAHFLAELRRDAGVFSVLLGTRLPPKGGWNEKPAYRLSSSTLLLAGGRALSLLVFTAYEGPGDLIWIRSITERWIADLQRLNKP